MGSFTIDPAPLAALSGRLEATGTRLADTAGLTGPAAAVVAQHATPPRRTGRLAASGTVLEDGVRWGVGYAVFVQYGTRRMVAQPFASDALAAAEPQIDTLAATWATDLLEET